MGNCNRLGTDEQVKKFKKLLSEDEMRALRVPNGAQVSAFDKEKNIIYIKSADMQGKTYFEKYEYNKIDESKEQTPIVDESKFMLKSDMESILNDIKEFKSKYVTKDDFEKFRSLFAGVKNENSSGSGESIQ